MKNCRHVSVVMVSVVAVIITTTAPLAGQQAPPAGAPTPVARPAPIKSPEIHPDRR